ncbi:MAG: SMC-Scp complex subunit ScpB [Acidobacteriaceae bacterium]
MSLKAKLEAVVYAAEEPVTLAQLAAIFAEEVLPGLEESSQADAAQLPLNGLVDEEGPAQETSQEASPEQAETAAVSAENAGEANSAGESNEAATGEAANGEAANGEAMEKKLARQRDRKVRQELQRVLDELIADYANSDRGMEIREIAGGYRMATKPEYHDAVRGFVKSLKPPMKLSLQALETLAVIAYKQPVTAPEVSEIRGVDSGGVLGSLISRKLITTAGRKPVIGRPILYKTTKEFLLRFGLKDVNDLPSMDEFEKMAGELSEPEAEAEVQEATMESSEELPAVEVATADADAEPDAEPDAEADAEAEHAAMQGSEQAPVADAAAAEPVEESPTEATTEPHL